MAGTIATNCPMPKQVLGTLKTRSGPKIPAGELFGVGEISRFGPNLDILQKSMDTDVEYCYNVKLLCFELWIF